MFSFKPKALSRLPPYIINGITVSLGLGIVQALAARVAHFAPAFPGGSQFAIVGAICASLPHLPDRAGRAARRVLAGGVFGCVAEAVVLSLHGSRLGLGFAIPALVFCAMLMLSWGSRAGPIAFAGVLGAVFSLALPVAPDPLASAAWSLFGVLVYAAWSFGSTLLLEARYRTLAVAACLRESARLLRARASIVTAPSVDGEPGALEAGLVAEEALLSSLLQSARDLVFHAHDSAASRRVTAVLLRIMDLRDLALASRLDLEMLGTDDVARGTRQCLARGLVAVAEGLDAAEISLREGSAVAADDWAIDARRFADCALDGIAIADDDVRRPLLPVILNRLKHLADMVGRIHALLRAEDVVLSVPRDELRRFAQDEGWPRKVLLGNLSLESSVFRHALRSALAVGSVFWLAHAMPWASRPHWLVLSVAVVLRGTVYETLSRRNARVLGTAIGCVVAVALVRLVPDSVLAVVFLLAAGTAHAFVSARYLLTAIAATVMALLQIHFASPSITSSVVERLVDTSLGAGFAWAFSYVLPSWERRNLPRAVARALAALQDYAETALTPSDVIAESRLARQRAYDELDSLRSILPRIGAEPARVRPPVRELSAFIERAQILLAHLSSVRLIMVRRRDQLDKESLELALGEARAALRALLAVRVQAPISRPPQPSELDLPFEPPERQALPWLTRRLKIALYDAAKVGAEARVTLEKLGATA